MYSELLTHFVRDVRKDLASPKLPVVWCGVGQNDDDFVASCSKMSEIHTAAKHPNFHLTVIKDGGHHCYQSIYGDPEF